MKFMSQRHPTWGQRTAALARGDYPFTKTEFRQCRLRLRRKRPAISYDQAAALCVSEWEEEIKNVIA